jgi:sulfate transport system ATP-binding protein
LFSGRVKDGAVVIGDTEFSLGVKTGENDTATVAFVRPHDIRVTRQAGGPALAAQVVRSNAAGPVANLELKRLDSGELFTVQLSKEQFQELQPKPGEPVFVELKNVKIFGDDYSI